MKPQKRSDLPKLTPRNLKTLSWETLGKIFRATRDDAEKKAIKREVRWCGYSIRALRPFHEAK